MSKIPLTEEEVKTLMSTINFPRHLTRGYIYVMFKNPTYSIFKDIERKGYLKQSHSAFGGSMFYLNQCGGIAFLKACSIINI